MQINNRISVSRISVSFYFFFCGLIFSTWAARIPSIKDHFELNEAQLGGLLFMLPMGSLVALPIAGWSVHRFGSKLVTFIAAIAYGLILMLISRAGGIWQLSVLLFCFGFAGDILNISMNTQGLSVQQILNKPILSGLHAQWSIGALAGAVIGGWSMKNNQSTSDHFMIVSITTMVIALWMFFYMVRDFRHEEPGQKLFTWPGKALLLLGMICFCTAMAEGAMADWSSLYYRQVLQDQSRVSTTGYTAFTFAMAIGRLIGDRLIQIFRYRNTLILNGVLISLGITLSLIWQVPVAVITGYALVGLGVSSVIPIVYMIAGKSRSMAPAAALATVSTIGFTGFLIGPPVIGFIAHETSLRFALILVVMLGIVIVLLAGKAVKKNSPVV
jgi:MFS family permease